MTINKSTENDKCTINLVGRLDTNSAPELEDALQVIFDEQKGLKTLVFDLAELSYMSSAGLRVVLATQKRMLSLDGKLVIKNVDEAIMEVFAVTGFSEVLTIE